MKDFSPEEIHLILVALATAKIISQQNGHFEQAEQFSNLAEKIRND